MPQSSSVYGRSRVRARIADYDRFRTELQVVVSEGFASLSEAARYAGIPQPTFWHLLQGERPVVAVGTLTRLRPLLRHLTDAEWAELTIGADQLQALAQYEDSIRAEIELLDPTHGEPVGRGWLPPEAEEEIDGFVGWGLMKGHHPERIRLGAIRIRQPLWASGPGSYECSGLGTALEVVRLGIRREKALLRAAPLPLRRLRGEET